MAKKQASGLYRTKIKIGVDMDGKPINKWISGKTKRELEEARREVEEKYIYNFGQKDDCIFGAYAVEWFRVRKRPGLSPSQVEAYRTALNTHILPVFGERMLRSITPIDLQSYMNTFEGCSSTKITMIQSTLKGIFTSAFDDRILMYDPSIHLKKPAAKEATEKRALTPEERKRVEEVCAAHEDGLYLALMHYLGVRPGEARGLQWGDIDWEEGIIHVQRDIDYKANGSAGKLKTKSSDRLLPMPQKLSTLLWAKRGLPDVYILTAPVSGGALSKTSAERAWIRLMIACGMAEEISQEIPAPSTTRPKDDRNARDLRRHYKPLITPHTLRHNYATMCWENDIDVYSAMRLLGHSSIKTTMDIYTHLTDSQLEKMGQMVDDMFSDQPLPNAAKRKSCTKVAQASKKGSRESSPKRKKSSKLALQEPFSRISADDPSGTRTRDPLIKSQRGLVAFPCLPAHSYYTMPRLILSRASA